MSGYSTYQDGYNSIFEGRWLTSKPNNPPSNLKPTEKEELEMLKSTNILLTKSLAARDRELQAMNQKNNKLIAKLTRAANLTKQYFEELSEITDAIAKQSEQNCFMKRLIEQRAEEVKDACPICYDKITIARATSCGHIFCESCFLQLLERDLKCPQCRASIDEPNYMSTLNKFRQKLDFIRTSFFEENQELSLP
jgi:hypothetical protein